MAKRSAACLACVVLVLHGCGDAPPRPVAQGGDAQRGRATIERYGCAACHRIAGLDAPAGSGSVGPPLTHMAERAYLAGVLPNTPQNLARWLRYPSQVDARTAMPELGLSAAEATDVAAYLYQHD